MDFSVDHYLVLGLSSGEEGSKLIDEDIKKAYRLKALELHPDKRPGDPNANHNFQKLMTSYELLKDEYKRKLFDDHLRVKRQKVQYQSQHDANRRKMMSDLEERERSYSNVCAKAVNEEKIISRKLKEEIARIRAMQMTDKSYSRCKVSWEKFGPRYTPQQLRDLFDELFR